jgi:hypothetical protein
MFAVFQSLNIRHRALPDFDFVTDLKSNTDSDFEIHSKNR